jgi:two-component system nitrate/nitrite response regulator NarL
MPAALETNKAVIKVQVIDSQQITLWGIQQLVNLDGRYKVSAATKNSAEALKAAVQCNPDVIILEPELDNEDGLALIPALLEKSKAKIIIYTSSKNPKILDEAVVRGARGIINKTEPTETLLKAIEKIHLGELWLNRNATSRILMLIAKTISASSAVELSTEQKKLKTLTVKEEKVTRAIQMYSENTLKEIADKLHISEHTLRNHLASTYDKLGVRNRLELYVFCGKYQKTDDPSHHPKRRSTDD